MKCTCPHLKLNGVEIEAKNLSPKCPVHGMKALPVELGDTVYWYWDGKKGTVRNYAIDPGEFWVDWDDGEKGGYLEWELRDRPGKGGRW